MLRYLLKSWGEKSLMEKMYKEFTKMLSDAGWMFNESCEAAFNPEGDSTSRSSLFKRDISINKVERKIRKQIVEHFVINPGEDIAACLILMSVVKDAERIGDYCKNIYDTRVLMGQALPEDSFHKRLRGAGDTIKETFVKVAKAFSEVDVKIVQEIIKKELEIGREFDSIVKDLAASALATKHAVCLTLNARHMKRISAHLGNIASSVVMPLHKIDYFDEKWK